MENNSEQTILTKQIEELSLNAWPSLQHILFDGWILRFSNGYTKRANSINPLYRSTIELNLKLDYCRKIYASKGLPVIFRLNPFSTPENLDTLLEKQGFGRLDETLVMHFALPHWETQTVRTGTIQYPILDLWLEHYCHLSETDLKSHETHKKILQSILSTAAYFSLFEANEVVACGMGVLERGYFGLFDIVTGPIHRNKGFGTALVIAMLQWAQQNGALLAYLQVVNSNAPAHRLYQKLGFSELHRYWYRVQNPL